MSDNELAIAVLGIIFGSIFAIIVVIKLIGLAKTWINRNKTSYDDETFDRLARAFIKHKKDSERRFQNLEAIISDEDSELQPAPSKNQLKETRPHQVIEVDTEEQKEKSKGREGNLRNMLKE